MKVFLYILVFFTSVGLYAKEVDLTANEVFVRRGYSTEWLNTPPNPKEWVRIPGRKGSKRALSVPELNLPGLTPRSFLSLSSRKPEVFTFVFPFEIHEGDAMLKKHLGLLLEGVGEKWEIYLNGEFVHKDTLTRDGTRDIVGGFVHNYLLAVPAGLLKPGYNQLVFKISGDPAFQSTGFYYGETGVLAPYVELENSYWEVVNLIFASVYLIFGFNHLLLFLANRRERYNLYFSGFTILLFSYLFMRSGLIQDVMGDRDVGRILELIFLYLFGALASGFFESILHGALSIVNKSFIILCVIFSAATLFVTPVLANDLVICWRVMIVFVLLYIFVILLQDFIKRVDERLLFYKNKPPVKRVSLSIYRSIISTVSGNLLIGTFIAFASVFYDLIAISMYPISYRAITYGFLILVYGLSFVVLNRIVKTNRKIEFLNIDLYQKISDLNDANLQISRNEKKYRMLIEGSDDIIVNLDVNGKIIYASDNILSRLKYSDTTLAQMNFIDMISEEHGVQEINRNMVRESMRSLLAHHKPVRFSALFKINDLEESLEMDVTMELIQSRGRIEVVARISNPIEDPLLQNFIAERQIYFLENSFIKAEELSHRLVHNMHRFLDGEEIKGLRIGLREIILNAIEHGSLDISFDEKSRETASRTYFEFLVQRKAEKESERKVITVYYNLNSTRALFRIYDEGQGFDYKSIRARTMSELMEGTLYHGRGILIAESVFDKVRYNERGNGVLLVKYFNKEEDRV